jgi:ligand-binding sensor domain-containing protein
MAQTTDGFLWLSAPSGLYRFDGVHFEMFQPPSGQPRLKRNPFALLAAPGNGLWVSFAYGGVSFIRNGIVTNYDEKAGLPANGVYQFIRDGAGAVWAVTGDALLRLEASTWKRVGADQGLPGSPDGRVFLDRQGTLWAVAAGNLCYLPKGSRMFRTLSGRPTGRMAFVEAADGSLWGYAKGVLARITRPDEGAPGIPAAIRLPFQGNATELLADAYGLWIATGGEGLYRIPLPGMRAAAKAAAEPLQGFRQKDGLSGDGTRALLRDREGNLWLATTRGLDQFRRSAIVPVQSPEGASGFSLVRAAGNRIQAASFSSSLLIEIGERGVVSQRSVPSVDSSYLDPEGDVWMGTRGRGRILRLSAGNLEEIAAPAEASAAITKDAAGRLWALFGGKGFCRLENGGWTNLATMGAPEHGGFSSYTDSMGRVWFGYSHNRVVLLRGDKAAVLSDKDGVAVGDVSTIAGRNGSVWIGGDDGIAMFEGHRFVSVAPAQGEAFSGVSAIVPTGEGIWIGESRGIIHIPQSQVAALQANPDHRVTFRTFDSLDGLPAALQPAFPAPSAVEGSDGVLWFATTSGIVRIDPKNIPANTLPPPVAILRVDSGGRAGSPTESGDVKLPAGATNLHIAYTAMSLTVPERVRFRYRLEGQEREWQDAGTRRDAYYTNLGPGAYRFHVIACNNDGLWNETGATLSLAIAPAFYQTWWTMCLYVALAAGLLWLFYLYRLNRATALLRQRLGARMEERERIARELHDTLLQGFQGLVLRFQSAMNALPEHEPAHRMLEQALDRADGVLTEGRQRVRDLRSEGSDSDELPRSLRLYGEELGQDRSADYSLTVLGTPQAMNPVVFSETERIAREAINNAFLHSGATRIEVELTFETGRVCLRVRDNGSGIDPQILSDGRAGHWGLSGMRERAQKIGAQFNIWSHSGAGTEIELGIPAAAAYPRKRKKSLRSRFTPDENGK